MKKLSFLLSTLVIAFALVSARPAAAHHGKGGTTLYATLYGDYVVTGGDPTGVGYAEVQLDSKRQQVCFHLSVESVDPITVSIIGEGAFGIDGPAVVTLTPSPGTDGYSEGCVHADREVIGKIASNPANYFVEVSNEDFPNGTLRGQLRR